MRVIQTERLALREFTPDDAAFVLALVNDPDWLRFIGDRGVHSLDDARGYIERGPMAMVAREGFGLWVVEPRGGGEPMGMCGLIRRQGLDDVDIGFAFLPAYRRRGYAREAAAATLRHARTVLELPRVVAITSPDNVPSQRLLESLGLAYQRRIELTKGDEVCLYAVDFGAGHSARPTDREGR